MTPSLASMMASMLLKASNASSLAMSSTDAPGARCAM
jgi:hypothetical protein